MGTGGTSVLEELWGSCPTLQEKMGGEEWAGEDASTSRVKVCAVTQEPRSQNGNQRTGTSRMCAVGQLIRSVQIEVVGQCSRKNIYLDSVDTIVKSHGLFPS